MRGYLRKYDMLLEEAKVLDAQLVLRRNLLDGKPIPEGSGRYIPTEVMELRKLLAQARIGREEAAQWLGITRNAMDRKLSGSRNFKQWQLMALTEMAKERLEAEWT